MYYFEDNISYLKEITLKISQNQCFRIVILEETIKGPNKKKCITL